MVYGSTRYRCDNGRYFEARLSPAAPMPEEMTDEVT